MGTTGPAHCLLSPGLALERALLPFPLWSLRMVWQILSYICLSFWRAPCPGPWGGGPGMWDPASPLSLSGLPTTRERKKAWTGC